MAENAPAQARQALRIAPHGQRRRYELKLIHAVAMDLADSLDREGKPLPSRWQERLNSE